MTNEQMQRRILRLESRLKFLTEEFAQCVQALALNTEQTNKLADLLRSRFEQEMKNTTSA
jgi:hypothetical protein